MGHSHIRHLLAAAALFSLGGAAFAQATTTVSGTAVATSPNPTITATDNTTNSVPGTAVSGTASVSTAQFDTANGVLTGVAATLETSGNLVRATNRAGTATAAASWTVDGSTVNSPAGWASTTTTQSSFAQLSNAGGAFTLANFAGTGSVAGSVTYSAQVNKTDTANGATQANLTVTAQQNLVYSYLYHSNASFTAGSDSNSLNLTGLNGAGSAFDIYALAGLSAANTIAMDGATVSCTGNCAAFSLSPLTISNLAANGSASGSAALIASTAGSYSASYLLTFQDDAGTAGVGHANNTLTLNVSGNVAAVPEPETYAMFLAGLGAMGFLGRRRKSA